MIQGKYLNREENIKSETSRCPATEYKSYCRRAAQYLIKTLSEHEHLSGILLDAGCRDGGLQDRATPLWGKLQYQGIDIVEHHIKHAQSHGRNCSVMDFCKLQHEDNSVAVVYSHHSLEHLWDSVAACRESFRVLKNGGLFIVVVPINKKNLGGDLVSELTGIGFLILSNYEQEEIKPGNLVQYIIAKKLI